MLNILKKKQKNFDYISLSDNNQEKNKPQDNFYENEHKNIIFYPSSSKEWFSSIYSYNKSYSKSLISINYVVNNLFWSYFNMMEDKLRLPFKRRRPNKIRYSADKIYVSRAELKHTNTKLTIMLYIYNKQKSSLERFIRRILIVKRIKENLTEEGIEIITTYKNRLSQMLKKRFFYFKKWNNVFFKVNDNVKNMVTLKRRYLKLYNISTQNSVLRKKHFRLEQIHLNYTKLLNLNIFKFNNLLLYFRQLGIKSIIEKMYNKNIQIKVIDLKSIHLNSDVFSSAVSLKLRDRKNKTVKILRKAILQMVKIPYLHTLITFDDTIESMNKDNILKVIKQQVVSGVRFEASGRLTRRLTAMRAVFKYRYTGSLKDIRSSLNNKSSSILRGHMKSNLQYTVEESKTRNGSFGLKCWVSSH
jgi:hypothetical protein